MERLAINHYDEQKTRKTFVQFTELRLESDDDDDDDDDDGGGGGGGGGA